MVAPCLNHNFKNKQPVPKARFERSEKHQLHHDADHDSIYIWIVVSEPFSAKARRFKTIKDYGNNRKSATKTGETMLPWASLLSLVCDRHDLERRVCENLYLTIIEFKCHD
jgi:hypothetical protein